MEIKAIDHVGMIVKDLEKAVAFYRDVMGFALTGEITPWAGSPEECTAMQLPEGTEYRCAVMEAPGGRKIQLMDFSRMQGEAALPVPGAHYLSFMADDMDGWVKKLEENGCKTMAAPLGYDDYGTFVQWCYVIDPNGVIFELLSQS